MDERLEEIIVPVKQSFEFIDTMFRVISNNYSSRLCAIIIPEATKSSHSIEYSDNNFEAVIDERRFLRFNV